MYEYKFVEADLGGFFSVANHRQLIEEHAKNGWRLVQVLAFDYNVQGRPKRYEIIFERKVKGDD